MAPSCIFISNGVLELLGIFPLVREGTNGLPTPKDCHPKADDTARGRSRFAFHSAISLQEFAANSPGVRRIPSDAYLFALCIAMNMREPATNFGVAGTDIACADCGQKRGNLLLTRMSRERIPHVTDAVDLSITVRQT